ncbi:MAG: hypothetical protein AAFX65_00465 [Cyanobacteria bacterium J06638_7]
MVDDSSTPAPQAGRPSGNREGGGFRIRLSDNEMRAARSIQEAFKLRSTVAVLGFAVRTVAQLLEEGRLDALVTQQQSQPAPREGDGGRRGERGSRDGGAGRQGGRASGRQERPPRVDPFARPARPAPEPAPVPAADPPPAAEPVSTAEPVAEAAVAEAGASDTPADPAETSGGA